MAQFAVGNINDVFPADSTLAEEDPGSPALLPNPLEQDSLIAPRDASDIYNMKIFVPDTTLTQSMPILKPAPVDEGIFLPFLSRCKEEKTENSEGTDGHN